MDAKRLLGVAAGLSLAACAPHIRPLQPVMENGEIVRSEADAEVARARAEGEAARARLAETRAAALGTALATCASQTCDAVARGEVALGMNEAQVLAATRTTADAWDTRRSGRAMVMTPRDGATSGPADAVAELAFVSFQGDAVSSYTYREPQGLRTVASGEDESSAGRSVARAEALLRQGDEYAAAGDLALALARYDQADILRPMHAETNLRIARVLDKQLRPIEAVLRYRLFIHQLELERLRAEGEVAARIAESIALAQQRIVVLERR